MKPLSEMGFYGILTNPMVGYEVLAQTMVDRGLRIIQLRMKDAAREDILETANRLREIIPPGVIFIVNDDPRIAIEVKADGVHLGQGDMAYTEARSLMGPDAVIGLSTHNPDQTRAACALGPDYIGVGPVYVTPTKKNPDPVIGLDGMAEMLSVATVPAVVLGGIDHDNVGRVMGAGANNICAVRCVNGSSDPGVELDRMLAVLGGGEG